MSPSPKCYVKLILFNNPFALALELGISCGYAFTLQFAFLSLFGVTSPSWLASTAGRPAESETLSVLPRPQPLGSSPQRIDSGWGDTQQKGPFYQRRWALMSLRHTQWLLMTVIVSSQCKRATKFLWLASCTGQYVFIQGVIFLFLVSQQQCHYLPSLICPLQ